MRAMSQTRRYILQPRGAFHFGERGVGVEETAELLHSDTLFAAMVSAWRLLGAETVEPYGLAALRPFVERQPPFRISSALPFAGPVQLFPRPFVPLGVEKGLKDVRYLSAATLGLVAQGARLSEERADRELIHGGEAWVLPEEREQIAAALLAGEPDPRRRERFRALWQRDPARMQLWWAGESLTPRVTVDRLSAQANLFHVGRLRFAHGCGLAFWATFADEAYAAQVEAALDLLQHEGLGGRRSAGHGQFDWRVEDASLPAAEAPTHHLTLSLYTPHEAERGLLERARYRRIMRRGWIASPDGRNLRRRGVWMLREGSLLDAPPDGAIHDVRPEIGFPHPVWRSGYALSLPLRFEGLVS